MKEWRKWDSCKIYSIHSGIAIHVWDTYTTAASENYNNRKLQIECQCVDGYILQIHAYVY